MSEREAFLKNEPAPEDGGEQQPSVVKDSLAAPGRFSFVCESLDGRLCLFEDADGHYTAVRASRLA